MELTTQEKIYVAQKYYKSLSFFDFCKELGYLDLNNVHKDLCDFIESPYRFKLVLMPRYSFKSTICTIGYSLYRLSKDLNFRILIYSDASTKAQGFLTSVKSHLEGKVDKSKFSAVFDWLPKSNKEKWNESQVVISARTNQFPEPSVDTGGIETSKVGMHYDLIIFDDIVSDKNVTTKDQMDKVEECYQRSLSLLKPGGDVIMVGTRWHFGDLYGRLITNDKSLKTFIVDGVDDVKYGKYCFSTIGLDEKFLLEQKERQGSYQVSCLYRNNPVDADTAIFKYKDFGYYGAIKPDDLYITATCDPAGEGKDMTAITVVGTDSNMDMNVLDVVNKNNMTPTDIINEIVRLHLKYRFKVFGIETIFLQKTIKLELARVMREKNTEDPDRFPTFKIEEFDGASRVGKSKFSRIMGLQPYHERGSIKFPGDRFESLKDGFSQLAHQMLEFTPDHMPEPNDALDALADHVQLIRKGGIVKKADIPINTPAYLERKGYDETVKNNNRLPSRFRRYINNNLAFS